GTENLSPAVPARAQRSGDHEFRRVQNRQPISAQFSPHHSLFRKELRCCHSRADACRAPRALAAPEQSESNNAQDGVAWAEDAGVARKIQRRPYTDEPGGDEALQAVRHQPGGRVFADGYPDSDFLRALSDARAGGGTAKREDFMRTRSGRTRYSGSASCARTA